MTEHQEDYPDIIKDWKDNVKTAIKNKITNDIKIKQLETFVNTYKRWPKHNNNIYYYSENNDSLSDKEDETHTNKVSENTLRYFANTYFNKEQDNEYIDKLLLLEKITPYDKKKSENSSSIKSITTNTQVSQLNTTKVEDTEPKFFDYLLETIDYACDNKIHFSDIMLKHSTCAPNLTLFSFLQRLSQQCYNSINKTETLKNIDDLYELIKLHDKNIREYGLAIHGKSRNRESCLTFYVKYLVYNSVTQK